MNKKTRKNGVVLKASDYKENAQIVYLYTPFGKESLIVRGSKKINSKTRGLAQTLTLIAYQSTTNRELNTLTEGEIIDVFALLKADHHKMNHIYPILEKLDHLGNSSNDSQKLYDFLLTILRLFEFTNYPQILLLIFEVKFLYLLGLAPRLTDCPSCGIKTPRGYFSVDVGGVLCERCQYKGYHLDIKHTEILKQLYLTKPEKINEQFLSNFGVETDTIQLTIDLYYAKYLDYKSKCKSVIRRLNASM